MLRTLIAEIGKLGAYTPEEWREYLGYFEDAEGLRAALPYNPGDPGGELVRRICSGTGADPARPDSAASPKLVTAERLAGKLRHGITLGVVSGCFDLLHLGHVRGMVQASDHLAGRPNPKLCAMTLSDENIRAKKGPSRPVMNLAERVQMIAGVRCIDYVVPLDEPNCLAALRRLRPDCFFKSSADTIQGIVQEEIELVRSLGASVPFFPQRETEGRSTTRLIEAVQNAFSKG